MHLDFVSLISYTGLLRFWFWLAVWKQVREISILGRLHRALMVSVLKFPSWNHWMLIQVHFIDNMAEAWAWHQEYHCWWGWEFWLRTAILPEMLLPFLWSWRKCLPGREMIVHYLVAPTGCITYGEKELSLRKGRTEKTPFWTAQNSQREGNSRQFHFKAKIPESSI